MVLKLERIALELFEYKVDNIRSKRPVRGGVSAVWDLYRHLQREAATLEPDERQRLERAGRVLMGTSEPSGPGRVEVSDFEEIVLGDWGSDGEPSHGPRLGAGAPARNEADASSGAEQLALQRLAAKVWRHDLDRFVRRLAGGLRAERERHMARLLYSLHRNLAVAAQRVEGPELDRSPAFVVREAMPPHDDPLFSANDVDSLAELVRETIEATLALADEEGPYRALGVRRSEELSTMHGFARAVAADPYAGRLGLFEQRGPTAQQLRVAIQELGKERMREEERVLQRRQLDDRLQRLLAFERNQRQLFHQDVARFTMLVDAFFDRLARYLPRAIGGQAGSPRLPGGVLHAQNPALRIDSVPSHVSAATLRLVGPARLRLGGLEVAVVPDRDRLYLRGEEHRLADGLALACERKWLYAFVEGEYLHLKLEDEARSAAIRLAEAAAVLAVACSPQRDELLAALRMLANTAGGEAQDVVRAALEAVAALTAQAPDRGAALEGFLRGSARAAGVNLREEVVAETRASFQRALSVDPGDLTGLLERLELADLSVHPITGEPLAVDVGSYTLTIRQYRQREGASQESMVVMIPGRTLGTFEEYLIEELGAGTLLCVRGDQELVVGYRRATRVTVGASEASV